ncbi:enoyl-CoA delta isomerase 1 [Mycolicibacterium holsaticum]|uniref:enoyl-CoA delta isomerase 1 n=1 Tax=Mycolicibacterium holsaticum TaxID=152142 RepID=UPI001C7D6549|nr:enoyl-CoA delta isomerase 1 [Mycolicibacterium holsaticum]MDA4109359.1 hypothetical protein [Mycolicibacterium holsaticum DSM 44478 = JCM 12374]QZA11743.1 enoyl-CoA delta isomerase 1 [Mycolicibacterium holsaticum DSM 44478 = JCM 12374]UNC10770.1 hypothetical protein H5U41_05300 [Mycolicibacterium holsaticum DSM 44478 = JCM 12374]
MDIWERGGAVDSSTALRVEQHADHVVVKLNLPTHRNAISAELITEPDAIRAQFEAAPRMLLLTGGGEHCSAGVDIRERRLVAALAGISGYPLGGGRAV